MDNPFGHEQIGGFQRGFEDNGGHVIDRPWVLLIGVVSALLWSPPLQNPANQSFMKLAEVKLGWPRGHFP